MPKREDENWARRREDKESIGKRSLCPFCGKGDRLYYNKRYKSWRCGYCEHSFPMPSGGKPVDKKEFVERYRGVHGVKGSVSRKPLRFKNFFKKLKWRRFSLWDIFLIILIAVGVAVIIYTANRILDHKVNTILGTVMIVVSSIILLWDVFVIASRQKRVKPKRVILTLLAFALIVSVTLTFAGIAPFSTAKDKIMSFFSANEQSTQEQNVTFTLESYVVKHSIIDEGTTMQLRTVAEWEGTGSKELKFKATEEPWVVNAGSTITSSLGSEFSVHVEWGDLFGVYDAATGYADTVYRGTGDFTIVVEASGCEWWVKIGEE